MKPYIVLLKLAGDYDSPYDACREDVVWWRCKKASSKEVAVKRAITAAQASLTFPTEISALAVEVVSSRKAAAVKDAYTQFAGTTRMIAGLADITCTIRHNAPELLA